MARAFRDSTGVVHLVAASSDLYESLGATLDGVQHNCDAAFLSANDPDPAAYNDQSWLTSFYTFDGKRVAALTHMEYHGWAHPGECGSQNFNLCEYDSDTYHVSNDGGYHFESFKAPNNFVAGIPYKYRIDSGPMGYSVDTNIVAWGGWYYALATAWTWPRNCTVTPGPHHCLTSGGSPIRTQNVFDPASWRGWNGSQFALTFADPYAGPIEHPQQHVYTPVTWMNAVSGINVYTTANVAVATLWDYWDDEYGPPGLYLSTSTDFVNWTKPVLVATLNELLADDPKGSWTYAYFSLLDPTATDRNFSTMGDQPYLYYVRLDNNSSSRVLFRRPIALTVLP
jgi:hypothetical protein